MRLDAAYHLNGFQRSQDLTSEQAHQVLLSFLLIFRKGLPRELNDIEKHRLLKARARRSGDWASLEAFAREVASKELPEALESMALSYGRWQNSECEEMRSTLQKMAKSPGRVALSDFHGSPKHPHYQFTEKEAYL